MRIMVQKLQKSTKAIESLAHLLLELVERLDHCDLLVVGSVDCAHCRAPALLLGDDFDLAREDALALLAERAACRVPRALVLRLRLRARTSRRHVSVTAAARPEMHRKFRVQLPDLTRLRARERRAQHRNLIWAQAAQRQRRERPRDLQRRAVDLQRFLCVLEQEIWRYFRAGGAAQQGHHWVCSKDAAAGGVQGGLGQELRHGRHKLTPNSARFTASGHILSALRHNLSISSTKLTAPSHRLRTTNRYLRAFSAILTAHRTILAAPNATNQLQTSSKLSATSSRTKLNHLNNRLAARKDHARNAAIIRLQHHQLLQQEQQRRCSAQFNLVNSVNFTLPSAKLTKSTNFRHRTRLDDLKCERCDRAELLEAPAALHKTGAEQAHQQPQAANMQARVLLERHPERLQHRQRHLARQVAQAAHCGVQRSWVALHHKIPQRKMGQAGAGGSVPSVQNGRVGLHQTVVQRHLLAGRRQAKQLPKSAERFRHRQNERDRFQVVLCNRLRRRRLVQVLILGVFCGKIRKRRALSTVAVNRQIAKLIVVTTRQIQLRKLTLALTLQ